MGFVNSTEQHTTPPQEQKNSSGTVYDAWVKSLPRFTPGALALLKSSLQNRFTYEGYASADAQFIGWQESSTGSLFPLFTITVQNHPMYHSTVTEKTLLEQHLQVPPTPPMPNRS